jgi:hypothetical protein
MVARTAKRAANGGSAATRDMRERQASKPRGKADARRASPPVTVPIVADGHDSAVRAKLVRDSFTMPKPEYSVLADLKLRAARLGRPIKKGELLRAGVAALRSMSDAPFLAALAVVPTLKPGRPKGSAALAPKPPHPRGKKHRKSA